MIIHHLFQTNLSGRNNNDKQSAISINTDQISKNKNNISTNSDQISTNTSSISTNIKKNRSILLNIYYNLVKISEEIILTIEKQIFKFK